MSNRLLARTLYRSMIRASLPYRRSNDIIKSNVLCCLLRRSDPTDGIMYPNLPRDDPPSNKNGRTLFLSLLREYLGGVDVMMLTPSAARGDVNSNRPSAGERMFELIRREFRRHRGEKVSHISAVVDATPLILERDSYSYVNKMDAAFMALRELNKKVAWARDLDLIDSEFDEEDRLARAVVSGVTPLSIDMDHPSSYLRKGVFFLAHPLMSGYFERTVICILDHGDGSKGSVNGTYGLVLNRPCIVDQGPTAAMESSRRQSTFREVISVDKFPSDTLSVIGGVPVREGGPVNVRVQMIHRAPSAFGGQELSDGEDPGGEEIVSLNGDGVIDVDDDKNDNGNGDKKDENGDNDSVSDRAVHFRGDVVKLARLVGAGRMDPADVSMVVGATLWRPGQLKEEVERGHWIPCRAPTDIVLTGTAECQRHDSDIDVDKGVNNQLNEVNDTSKSSKRDSSDDDSTATSVGGVDLWVSMMTALGEEEGMLARTFAKQDPLTLVLEEEDGRACDDRDS